MSPPCVLMVIGEAGQGKSTLISHFFTSTDEVSLNRINKLIPEALVQTETPSCGDDTGGVTKNPAFYPAVIAGRDCILIDMPGMQAGDETAAAKPGELLTRFQAIMSQTSLPLNGVLSCVQVGNRLTMGQDFCQQLVAKCLYGDEASGTNKWDQIICVGTKKDAYYCGKKKQAERWEAWRTSFLQTMNKSKAMVDQGASLKHCILVNICVDEEEDDPTATDELDNAIQRFTGAMVYRGMSDDELVEMMNKAFGKIVIKKNELEIARKVDSFSKLMKTMMGAGAVVGSGIAGLQLGGTMTTVAVVAAEATFAAGAITAAGSTAIACGGVVVGTAAVCGLGKLAKNMVFGKQCSQAVNEAQNFVTSPLQHVKQVVAGEERKREQTPSLVTEIACDQQHEICAFLSSQVYSCEGSEATHTLHTNLQSYALKPFASEVRHISVLHSDPADPHSPVAVLVHQATMYIAFRGTKAVVDVMTDCDCIPVSSPLWMDLCAEVKVHNGMGGRVQNEMLEFIGEMQKLVASLKVKDVIFTGHSLGGGMAHIALLAALGQKEANFRLLEEKLQKPCMDTFCGLTPVRFFAVTFAAPMVFHFPNDDFRTIKRQAARNAIYQLRSTLAVNYVFDDDIVPRFPRHVAFLKRSIPAVIKVMASQWVEREYNLGLLPKCISAFFGSKVAKFSQTLMEEALVKIQLDLNRGNYQHACKILLCHQDSQEARGLQPEEFADHCNEEWSADRTKKNQTYIIEYHSVCPGCVGGLQRRVQAERIVERQKHYQETGL